MTSSVPVTFATDQENSAVRTVTLTMDTSGAYTSGDVHADTQAISTFYRATGGSAVINSLTIIDEDDQKAALDVYIFSSSASLGTENTAASISDANARNIIGRIRATSTDYTDLGGVSIGFVGNLGIPVVASSGALGIAVGTIIGTAATFSSSGMRLYFGTMF